MPTFRLWCRTAQVSEDQYVATVCVIPADEDAAGAIESETRILPTVATAQEACAEMASAMHERLRARGDTVTQTDFV